MKANKQEARYARRILRRAQLIADREKTPRAVPAIVTRLLHADARQTQKPPKTKRKAGVTIKRGVPWLMFPPSLLRELRRAEQTSNTATRSR
jgi:hypothetical protein